MISLPAIILCGGRGTRISGIFPGTAKSLIPVEGRPLLETLVCQVRQITTGRIVLAAGVLGAQVESFVNENRFPNLSVVREQEPLGTAGAVFNVQGQLSEESSGFLVFNGDTLFTDVFISEVLGALSGFKEMSSLAIRARASVASIGSVFDLGPQNQILGITRCQYVAGDFIHSGIWLFESDECFKHISYPMDLEPCLDMAVRQGFEIRTLDVMDGGFADLGTPSTYKEFTE